MRPLPAELDALARRQYGLLTWWQLVAMVPPSRARRYIGAGVLIPVRRAVYRLAGVPPSWRQRLMAVTLAIGMPCAASHLAAARLWGAPSVATPELELTVPHHRRVDARDVRIHRRWLPGADLSWRWDIPVTTTARTVLDLAGVVPDSLVQRVFDDLVRAGLLRAPALEAAVARAPRLGLRQRSTIDALLSRGERRGVGGSPQEDWVVDTLVGAGLPMPARHHIVDLGDRLVEIDAAYPEAKVAIEYDGWAAHGDRTHFDGDRDRQALLQLAGWITLSVTSTWTERQLIDRVTTALALRARS